MIDSARRRSSMTVAGQPAVDYTWDNANRLTSIAHGSAGVGLSYDSANRRTTLMLSNGVVAYSYGSGSHVTGLTYSANGMQLGTLTDSYDPDGRRTAAGGSLETVTLPDKRQRRDQYQLQRRQRAGQVQGRQLEL